MERPVVASKKEESVTPSATDRSAPARDRYPRVTKTLKPGQSGTLKLQRRFGAALVCVRYRQDAQGRGRCTTVELVVDEGPIVPHRSERAIVYARIGHAEDELRRLAIAMGARWSTHHQGWRMTLRTARLLGIDPRAHFGAPAKLPIHGNRR